MEKEDVILKEESYQIIKKYLGKNDDYYNIQELNLMQFLMQCQEKVIKNEEIRRKF